MLCAGTLTSCNALMISRTSSGEEQQAGAPEGLILIPTTSVGSMNFNQAALTVLSSVSSFIPSSSMRRMIPCETRFPAMDRGSETCTTRPGNKPGIRRGEGLKSFRPHTWIGGGTGNRIPSWMLGPNPPRKSPALPKQVRFTKPRRSIRSVRSIKCYTVKNLNPSCRCAAKATQFPASPEIGQQATPQDGAFTRAWSYRQPWHDGQFSGPAQSAMKLSLHLPPRLRRQRLRLQQGPLHRRLRSPQRPIRPLSTEPEINPEGCPNGGTQHGWCRQSGYSCEYRKLGPPATRFFEGLWLPFGAAALPGAELRARGFLQAAAVGLHWYTNRRCRRNNKCTVNQ